MVAIPNKQLPNRGYICVSLSLKQCNAVGCKCQIINPVFKAGRNLPTARPITTLSSNPVQGQVLKLAWQMQMMHDVPWGRAALEVAVEQIRIFYSGIKFHTG